jgi:hypothetical protein
VKNTLIVMSSNREMEEATRETVARLAHAGAVRLMETGSSDVALARCRALSWACEQLRRFTDRDVVLMLDDDMEVPTETAQLLADTARERGRPCSAAYATMTASLAAKRWTERPGTWLVGLGCIAIPRTVLLDLESRADKFEFMEQPLTAFTWSGAQNGEWVSEDYRLSMNLGGVHLMPVAVGHIKKGSIWPDVETLKRLEKLAPDVHSLDAQPS